MVLHSFKEDKGLIPSPTGTPPQSHKARRHRAVKEGLPYLLLPMHSGVIWLLWMVYVLLWKEVFNILIIEKSEPFIPELEGNVCNREVGYDRNYPLQKSSIATKLEIRDH